MNDQLTIFVPKKPRDCRDCLYSRQSKPKSKKFRLVCNLSNNYTDAEEESEFLDQLTVLKSSCPLHEISELEENENVSSEMQNKEEEN